MDDVLARPKSQPRCRFQPFLFLFLLFVVASSPGCAPSQPSVAGTTKDSDNLSLPGAVQAAEPNDDAQKIEPVPEKTNRIRITQDLQKTVLSIPAFKETMVNPAYKHPVLKLIFSPKIAPSSLPELDPERLLAEIKPVRASNEQPGIKELQLFVREKIKFLVSRPKQNLINLLLVPAADRVESAPQQADVSGSQPQSVQLHSIQFLKDERENQSITLATSRPIQYKVLPSPGRQIKLFFPELTIPSEYEKLYTLHAFKTSVKSALLQNTSAGGLLVLKTVARSPIHIERDQNRLTLLITNDLEPGGQDRKSPPLEPRETSQDEKSRQSPFSSAVMSQADNGQTQGSFFQESMDSTPRYSGKPISIDLQDAEVEHVLRLLATVGGYNLVLDQGVQGRISLKLDRVPWDQALDIVLGQLSLEKSLQGNVLRILTQEQYNREQQLQLQRIQAQKEAEKSREELAPLLTRYIQVNYTTAAQLQPQLQSFLSERGKLSSDARTNQLIIHDSAAVIKTVENVVNQLDRPEKQVLIEARLVNVTDEFQRSLGIKWGGGLSYETIYHGDTFEQGLYGTTTDEITADPATGPSGFAVNLPAAGTATLGIGGFISKLTGSDLYTLDAQLELGESQDQVETISSPRVVTLNNVRAEMTQGTKIATQAESESGGTTTEYVEATLKLSVLPQITPDKKIILDLEISDDSPTILTTGGNADIETRSARTKLLVDNEQTIVIGGVQQLTERRDQSKVPGAGDIPLLGWLFKNKNIQRGKRELLIFIHPKIVE